MVLWPYSTDALLIYSILNNFNFSKICWTYKGMLFSLLQLFWAINIKLILLSILSPNMRRFVQDFFYVVDRYVRQVCPTDRQSHENLL